MVTAAAATAAFCSLSPSDTASSSVTIISSSINFLLLWFISTTTSLGFRHSWDY
ncbi:hypothetical protein SODALDRAFT_360757 [Sodiomyces alkalinus F11]|uniref:Uncharacterized protein n=1 Tax=Sodiomyces alkalinus (strain CBS 110278 / VKM F-3762 / F11) TaxID=1314773 RepID=A0A3N2PRD6_SODAK|nr:hypothetical protein SODALDRAFT_360757 [Sodiomyces alkalinus F11]ROT37082.1 hypothetical protein SODALDRAFT_360757 [Sodiomyces alkalinus F11]